MREEYRGKLLLFEDKATLQKRKQQSYRAIAVISIFLIGFFVFPLFFIIAPISIFLIVYGMDVIFLILFAILMGLLIRNAKDPRPLKIYENGISIPHLFTGRRKFYTYSNFISVSDKDDSYYLVPRDKFIQSAILFKSIPRIDDNIDLIKEKITNE